ncbi:MBL fold metallo-hydrolase [Tropicimonas sp. IMCC34043]|uniref:MBL fold metallo-hydrolase n=1 Tax=Tropicimonas sp. IMCC34043 TaxID=2248760 RepID=UPI000E27AA6C|nr:MBL fold metallo-hydrolase [Tropicimonas sp. IMCC34043]
MTKLPEPAFSCVTIPEPGLRRVLAPNPSPMTERGTNTYLVGKGAVAVIDPGPDDASHLQKILGALGPEERISHILVTHAHKDHSPLARRLAARTGAPVLGFGPHDAGRSALMEHLAAEGLGGGEGIDADFLPDHALADGAVIEGAGWRIEAVWTPGHLSNHLCFAWQGALFTGDHVMGWASSLVSPPDGDLTAFMASCDRLAARSDRVYYPGHGAPVQDPAERIGWLIAHRRAREAQILAELDAAPADAATLAHRIYRDTPAPLLPAAERNVLAHLIDLSSRGMVAPLGPLGPGTVFRPVADGDGIIATKS